MFKDQKDFNEWVKRVSKAPLTAMISTEEGASGSMKITSGKKVTNGKVDEIFNDDIDLSINQSKGDTTSKATAIISFPQDKNEKPKIHIKGNADVKNKTTFTSISIVDNKKKLKAKSKNGLFAVATVNEQRDSGHKIFNILFGESGKQEVINPDGLKTRPHIAFFPDGNLKFVRFSGYECDIITNLDYGIENKKITPDQLFIKIKGYYEKLRVSFDFIDDEIVLNDMTFV